VCDSRQLIMRYRDGHLCEMTDRFDCELSLSVHPPALAAAS
jgi:hypothetical protein